MKQAFFVRRRTLFAAALAASHESKRYYLNGIYIAAGVDGGAEAVATNGNILIAVKEAPLAPPGTPAPAPCIVPLAIIARLEKLTQANGDDILALEELPPEQLGASRRFRIAPDGVEFKPVDAEFPDWQRALPKGPGLIANGQPYNQDYLALLGKAGKLLTGNKSFWAVPYAGDKSGSSAAWVPLGCDDAVAVIAPIKTPLESFEPPAWLRYLRCD